MPKGETIVSMVTTQEDLNSSTTLQDSSLHLNLTANIDYMITIMLILENGGGGFRFDSSHSGGTWGIWESSGNDCVTGGTSITFDNWTSVAAGGVGSLMKFHGRFEVSGSDIDFILTWAQDVSNGNDSSIMVGSWMRAMQASDDL